MIIITSMSHLHFFSFLFDITDQTARNVPIDRTDPTEEMRGVACYLAKKKTPTKNKDDSKNVPRTDSRARYLLVPYGA